MADLVGSIVGMLLGDASVVVHQGKDAYLTMRHCAAQRQYALYKAELLKELTHVRVYEGMTPDARTGRTYHWIQVVTRRHPLYSRLRRDWYGTGRKAVVPFWLQKLDQRGFAIWYFDDGMTKPRHRAAASGWMTGTVLYLATLAFSWPECDLLSTTLHKKFGLHTRVRRWVGGKPILYVQAKSHQRVRDLLAPYAEAAGMTYKLPDAQPQQLPLGDETV